MRRATKATRQLLLPCLMGLAGCFSLSRVEPAQQHYVLGGSAPGDGPELRGQLAGLTLGVRRLRLAPYLEPPFVVVRQGDHQIRYAEFQRWGERLDGGINRAVASYLRARASFAAVDVAPWPSGETYDYLVQLRVDRFEGQIPDDSAAVAGEAHLLAGWEIIRQGDETVLARGTTDYRKTGWRLGDHAGLVALLDAGLDVLSADLADALEKLVAGRATEGGGPSQEAAASSFGTTPFRAIPPPTSHD